MQCVLCVMPPHHVFVSTFILLFFILDLVCTQLDSTVVSLMISMGSPPCVVLWVEYIMSYYDQPVIRETMPAL